MPIQFKPDKAGGSLPAISFAAQKETEGRYSSRKIQGSSAAALNRVGCYYYYYNVHLMIPLECSPR